jgi:hypothetical protein
VYVHQCLNIINEYGYCHYFLEDNSERELEHFFSYPGV